MCNIDFMPGGHTLVQAMWPQSWLSQCARGSADHEAALESLPGRANLGAADGARMVRATRLQAVEQWGKGARIACWLKSLSKHVNRRQSFLPVPR